MTEEQQQRIHDLVYSCDARADLARYIVKLEVACDEQNKRIQELKDELSDMFNWLVLYLTPEQYAMWEARLEELDVEPTWRWTR